MVLLEFTDETRKYTMNSEEYTIVVFLDLAKAFDTADPDNFIKLNHYGVRGVANK